jgi:hypothetical protein
MRAVQAVLMPLEAAISFGREPEYSTTHNSARRKRAGPRLNMGEASEIVAPIALRYSVSIQALGVHEADPADCA